MRSPHTLPMVVTIAVVSLVALTSSLGAVAVTRPSSQGSDLPSPNAVLDTLGWLEGEWQRATSSGLAIERWHAVAGVGLVGETALQRAGAETEIPTEALLIIAMGDDVFYIARPAQNPYPTGFRLVSLTTDEAVFENPTHDFPQRLVYTHVSDEAMTASIEGPADDGQVQRIDFEFVRR